MTIANGLGRARQQQQREQQGQDRNQPNQAGSPYPEPDVREVRHEEVFHLGPILCACCLLFYVAACAGIPPARIRVIDSPNGHPIKSPLRSLRSAGTHASS